MTVFIYYRRDDVEGQGCSTLYTESLKQQALAISCATTDEGFLGPKKSESM
jgi:hypothetical protein